MGLDTNINDMALALVTEGVPVLVPRSPHLMNVKEDLNLHGVGHQY